MIRDAASIRFKHKLLILGKGGNFYGCCSNKDKKNKQEMNSFVEGKIIPYFSDQIWS